METWLAELRCRGLAARSAILFLAVLVFYVLVAPVAGWLSGLAGLQAAATAAGLCLAGAAVALVASHVLRGPKYVLYGMFAGMAARMGIPLGFGLAWHHFGGALAEAGLLVYLLIFYPVTLAVETALSLPKVDQSGQCSGASQDAVS